MRSLSVESKSSEAYSLDIGHSSHVNNPACLRTSALWDSALVLHVLLIPLTASGPKGSLKVGCAVRPPGRITAAIPVDAVHKTRDPRALRDAAIVVSVNVLPVPAGAWIVYTPPSCVTLDVIASNTVFCSCVRWGISWSANSCSSCRSKAQSKRSYSVFSWCALGKPYLSVDLPCLWSVGLMDFRPALAAADCARFEAKSAARSSWKISHSAQAGARCKMSVVNTCRISLAVEKPMPYRVLPQHHELGR